MKGGCHAERHPPACGLGHPSVRRALRCFAGARYDEVGGHGVPRSRWCDGLARRARILHPCA
ncbi:MAG: hypothetical protein J7601_03760, partial [Chloroflexi bacterium]|nr:hypothetical protein [Chloroflexota bacterium]